MTQTAGRYIAPRAGWYQITGYWPIERDETAPVHLTFTNASRVIDPDRMLASIGEHIVINGPTPIRGILRSFTIDAEDVARMTVEPQPAPTAD